MKRRLFNLFLVLVMAISFSTTGFAQDGGLQPSGEGLSAASTYSADAQKGAAPSALRGPLAAGDLEKVSVIVTFSGPVDAEAVANSVGGEVIYRYSKLFNGASMVLDGEAVDQVSKMNGVTKVYLDERLHPQTEVSPDFIGAPTIWNALGGQESAGEGVVVGVLDSGIWPEHPSFSDPDPSGKPFAPPAAAPGSNGFAGAPRDTCDFGNTAYNPTDAGFDCNNKLIGAYQFLDTYKALVGLLPTEFDSARDDNGHGTHTASTAAGNASVPAEIFDVEYGLASGIAPRAHVIAYRVCADLGCYSSDSVAAVEQAILDEVDTINFSISGGNQPYSDIVSLAFLSAYENGVFVAASAGNSGPGPDTTAHREPWVTTVAASTSDRHFLNEVTLTANNGDTITLTGASVTEGISTPTPVIFAPGGPTDLCLNPFPAGTFNGEIVICMRGVNARVSKGYNVLVGGASGMILYNPALQGLATDNHFLPATHLESPEGAQLVAFMTSHSGVMGTITAGTPTTVLGDMMAAFSSRGGTGQTLGISKPDITAPGVQILAGHTPFPATEEGGRPGQLFQAIQGTSMSSPHVAGSGALMKALHPNWTPGQIKSALMTTAFAGVVKEDGSTAADPFDYGSGRVDLTKSGNPGLTFDETGENYLALEEELWNSNYPSLFVPVMPGIITVERTVKSVLGKDVKWNTYVEAPADLKVIAPRPFRLNAGASHTFQITVDATNVPIGQLRFATLYLTTTVTKNQTITLRFPITIIRKQPVVTLDKTCTPASIASGTRDVTTCTITMQNNSFEEAQVTMWDNMPKGLSLVRNSVVGANVVDGRKIVFEGSLAGALPPNITIGPGTSPVGGYLPLAGFGIAPISGVGDETITNFNVPGFMFGGDLYTRIGMVSNGYAVVGGGGTGDINYLNQSLPDPAAPNNVLAPFWTDLNPAAGGAMRIGILSDGVDSWLVLEWENVPNYTNGAPNSFQIWILIGAEEDIDFVYGAVTLGDGGLLTVGAENRFGNSGGNFFYNGEGTAPGPDVEVQVGSAPSAPGEIHTVTFQARGGKPGPWTNCAYMTSDLFQGTNVACFSGEVTGAVRSVRR